ncbi:MAG: hypothetical protein ABIJ12_14130, partial [bacterium]
MPKVKKEEKVHWKDYVNRESVSKFASDLSKVYKDYDQKSFIDKVCTKEFFDLELKDRLNEVGRQLKPFMPDSYKETTDIFIKAAPHTGGLYNWSMTAFIEQYGLDQFDISVNALKELT